MTWADRIGNAAREVVVLCIDLITIGTDLLRQVATHLDQLADDLKEAVEPKKT